MVRLPVVQMDIIQIARTCECSSEYARSIRQSTRAKYPRQILQHTYLYGRQLIWSRVHQHMETASRCCNTSEREFSCARVLRMRLPNASTFTNIGISFTAGTDGIVCVCALRTHTFRYTCVHRPLSCALTFVGTSSKVVKPKDTKRYFFFFNSLFCPFASLSRSVKR